MRKLTRKPSPAMIVAIAALCISLIGTAVAAPIAVISLNKKEKRQIRKIANRQITNRAPSLSVGNAGTVGGVSASALTVGRSSQDLDCFGTANYTCASVTLNLPRAGRVLLVSQLPMHPDAANSSASCRLTRNGAEIPNTTTTPGANEDADSNQDSEIANGGVTVVTGVLAAGATTFAQVCSDTSGNPHFRRSSLSAVLLGTD